MLLGTTSIPGAPVESRPQRTIASSNPANGFFYLLTGLHGVHLLGGLVAWVRTSAKVRAGEDNARINMSVGLCAVYWHFLLVVWLVLFGLLLLT